MAQTHGAVVRQQVQIAAAQPGPCKQQHDQPVPRRLVGRGLEVGPQLVDGGGIVGIHVVLSGAGMRRVVHLSQPLLADVSVQLGRREVAVAEQLLHDAKIGPAVEQMGGEGVTQRVRVGRRGRPAVAGGTPTLLVTQSVRA